MDGERDAPDEALLRIGTRRSRLALWQSEHVKQGLERAWPGLRCRLVPFVTQGDRRLDRGLPELGGKGLFTAELERALLEGSIDMAVHSLKDLPVTQAPGLMLGAVLARAAVGDVLVSREDIPLDGLAPGATVGTSSPRRRAQLLAFRPDLEVRSVRGNVETRVRKVDEGELAAVVLAEAGLLRLDMADLISERLPLERMLPAPGQGALGVQCRADDRSTHRRLAAVHDADCAAETTAERNLLHSLQGGCAVPVAALARTEEARLFLRARVYGPRGERVVSVQGHGEDPEALGRRLAEEALALGARALLDDV